MLKCSLGPLPGTLFGGHIFVNRLSSFPGKCLAFRVIKQVTQTLDWEVGRTLPLYLFLGNTGQTRGHILNIHYDGIMHCNKK